VALELRHCRRYLSVCKHGFATKIRIWSNICISWRDIKRRS